MATKTISLRIEAYEKLRVPAQPARVVGATALEALPGHTVLDATHQVGDLATTLGARGRLPAA